MTALLVNLGLYLLSAVFLVAGFAKLADLTGTSRSLTDFGVPEAFRPTLTTILPRLEITIGVALLVPAVSWWAALGGGALLLVFVIGIAYRLSRGENPTCHCFGKLHSRPVDNLTLARNVALAGVALALAFTSPGRTLGSWAWLTILGWREWLAVASLLVSALLTVVLLRLWQQQGRLMNELRAFREGVTNEGHGGNPETKVHVGSRLPTTTVVSTDGSKLRLGELLAKERDTLLLFVNSNCGPCKALLPEVRKWEQASEMPMPLVIQSGPVQLGQHIADEFGLTAVYSDPSGSALRAFGAGGTPAGAVVRPDGVLGSSVVSGARALRSLAARAGGSTHELRDEEDVVQFDNLPTLGSASQGS